MKRSAKSGALTLPLHATASPPPLLICAATASTVSTSTSLTTTRAPSAASFSAIERPIPRPEPVTSATFPSSCVMLGEFRGCSDRRFWRVRSERDQCVTEDLGLAVLVGAADFDAQQLCAALFELLDHLAAAGDDMSQMGDAEETRVELAQVRLRRPLRDEAAQPGHYEHAMREHIRHAGPARVIDIDVDRMVIARGAGEQRKHGPVHRREDEIGERISELDPGKGGGGHRQGGHGEEAPVFRWTDRGARGGAQ